MLFETAQTCLDRVPCKHPWPMRLLLKTPGRIGARPHGDAKVKICSIGGLIGLHELHNIRYRYGIHAAAMKAT